MIFPLVVTKVYPSVIFATVRAQEFDALAEELAHGQSNDQAKDLARRAFDQVGRKFENVRAFQVDPINPNKITVSFGIQRLRIYIHLDKEV